MSDAETLRRAAALIRERAEAAMPANGDRWESYALPDTGPNQWRMTGVGVVGDEMGHSTPTPPPALPCSPSSSGSSGSTTTRAGSRKTATSRYRRRTRHE